MNVFLQSLIETTADHEELIPENGIAKVAALHMRHSGQVAPLRIRLGQEVRDLIRDADRTEAADHDYGFLKSSAVDEMCGGVQVDAGGLLTHRLDPGQEGLGQTGRNFPL